jgi:hypothetical protein
MPPHMEMLAWSKLFVRATNWFLCSENPKHAYRYCVGSAFGSAHYSSLTLKPGSAYIKLDPSNQAQCSSYNTIFSAKRRFWSLLAGLGGSDFF